MLSKDECSKLLTVAVGNSHTRLTVLTTEWLYPSFGLLDTVRLSARSHRSIARRTRLEPGADVVIGGVVPKALDWLETGFREEGYRVWRFRKHLPCPLKVLPKPAKQVGDDRLAAAMGAFGIDASCPWVIVDSGTALTINAVRPTKGKFIGIFEGGLIMPGERLSLLALHRGTAQLPDLEPWPMTPPTKLPALGRSTEEAIRVGVRRQQVAAIVAAVEAQAKELGPKTRVLLTGGGAVAIFKELHETLRQYKPGLHVNGVGMGLLTAFGRLKSRTKRPHG